MKIKTAMLHMARFYKDYRPATANGIIWSNDCIIKEFIADIKEFGDKYVNSVTGLQLIYN